MAELDHLRVAVLATDGFEESELTEPVRALRDGGGAADSRAVFRAGGRVAGVSLAGRTARGRRSPESVRRPRVREQREPVCYL